MSKITDVSREEKKMLRSVFLRSFTLYTSVTPAKQGASGFCYSMIPFINRFYKDDPEGKKEAMARHISYFNTTVPMSTFIMGLCGAMEKENSENKDLTRVPSTRLRPASWDRWQVSAIRYGQA